MQQTSEKSTDSSFSGLTPTSLVALITALVLQAVLVHVGTVHLRVQFPFEHVIPLPALITVLAFSLISGVYALLWKVRLLNRAQLTCILFALMFSAPMMSQSLWHRMVSILATNPRSNSMERIESMGEKAWPHGPNLLPEEVFATPGQSNIKTTGNVKWGETDIKGNPESIVILRTGSPDEQAYITLPLSVLEGEKYRLIAGDPYFISTLLRFQSDNPDTEFFCRLRYPETDSTQEVFRGRKSKGETFQHPEGFQREGRYGVELRKMTDTLFLEIGLEGEGQLELRAPRMFSVSALERLYQGQEVLTEENYRALPPDEQAGKIYRPDNLFSFSGVKYLLVGLIPLDQWKQPIIAWGSFFTFLLVAVFAANVILRKQWMENERYSMPIGKLAMFFLDEDGDRRSFFVQSFWRNRMVWAGFAISLFWVLMRGWNFYNPSVPDMNVRIPMSTYFSDPGWGGTFTNVTFTLSAVFIAVGLFMELNILMSLVVGFWGFRLLYWLGEFSGLDRFTTPGGGGYPWGTEMQVGAFLAYGLVIVVFTRKYFYKVLQSAITRGDPMSKDEALSYRTSLILFFGALVASVFWADWMGVSRLGIFLIFSFLVVLCIVCSKIRAECGVPFGYFGSALFSLLLFVNLVGGMPVFDHTGVLVALIISFFVGPTPFLLIPGAQMEMLEIGRRFQITPRHLFYTCLLGIFGGVIIGGWIFLSSSYAAGGDSMPYSWAYVTKVWFFGSFNRMMADANAAVSSGQDMSYSLNRDTIGFAIGAGLTIILSVIRQMFAAFTFHPAGLILAPSWMLDNAWGSLSMAWFIRWMVLKLGGAATVREKLIPCAAGLFLGACVGQMFWGIIAWSLYTQDLELIYTGMP